MDDTAVVATLEGIESSVAALGVVIRGASDASGDAIAAGADPLSGADPRSGADPLSGADALLDHDPLQDLADAYLDGLAGVAGLEARLAALKVHLAAGVLRRFRGSGGAGTFCAGAHRPADGGDRRGRRRADPE